MSLKYLNGKAAFYNIKLLQAALTLTSHFRLLSHSELRHAINAFTLVCRESDRQDTLKMNFDKV